MLLSELGGKEIVNLNDGGRLGMIADSDVIIDENTGKIISLLLPDKRVQFKLFREKEEIEIPWDSIKKVGDDMIIVEIEDY